ncbi:MAG: methyltransferase domain-containing protein, partial [Candidatus Kariarchaeaceae archaeon]
MTQTLRKVVLEMLEKCRIESNRYLDLGCGNGSITNHISQQVSAQETFGLDINATELKQAPTNITTIEFDLEE